MREGIFWLVSYPKSGNTWTRIFLSNYLSQPDEPVDINNLDKTPIASARALFDDFVGVESGHLTYAEIDALRPEAYIRWSRSPRHILTQSGLRISKVHDAYTFLPDGQPLFPLEATRGIIYIVRNPLDVAVSYANHNNSEIDQSIAMMGWPHAALSNPARAQSNQLRQKLLTWSQHVVSWNTVPNCPRLLMRYEDMTHKPEETFGALIKFIDEEYDEERLAKAIEHARFDKIKAQEEEVGFGEKPYRAPTFFRKGKVGSWRESLTHEQVARLIDHHRRVMHQLGYLKPNGKLVY